MSLLSVYHRLPPSLQSAIAAARGWYLDGWRYGPETERLVAAALDREGWSAERWSSWQQERLAYVLHRAATLVPYYREIWNAKRRAGDRGAWDLVENWPILEKEEVRRNPRAFVADDCDVRRMIREYTSGSTGKALTLLWSRETSRAWYALFEGRWRGWHGVTRRDRWANLGGQLVVPQARRRPPFWVWNPAMRQLYMSSYHLAPELIPHYLDALERYRIRYLYGYASSLYTLAKFALRAGTRLAFEVVLTNAEPLYDHQRDAIGEAFGCPVRETYGMSEIVMAAGECPNGSMHLWPDVGFLELVEGAAPAGPGVGGDFVSSGLVNADMPLIRYRVGDRGRLAANGAACACGRTLPGLAAIEGRSDDLLVTPDGRTVGRLDPIFKGRLAVEEAQIIQETVHRLRLRYVPASGAGSADMRALADRLRDRMGPIEVILEQVDRIERGSNGKFKGVVSRLAPTERDELATTRAREPSL